MQEAFLDGAQTGSIDSKGSGKRHILSQMLGEMMAIDRERALITMKVWAKFVENAAGRRHTQHFATLEDYIPYRSLDVGQMFVDPQKSILNGALTNIVGSGSEW